jgi:uncharacterized protein (TIGR02271 family)
MLNTEQLGSLEGSDLIGMDGESLGEIQEVYVDDETGEPEFAVVKVGLFGTGSRFVPLQGARSDGDGVRVDFTKDQVKDSPDYSADGDLSQDQEREIYSFYGIAYSERQSDTGLPAGRGTEGTATTGRDTSGPTTDDAMTRSEEELRVGTERREAGRVRLRKYVVTENVTKTVPVKKEKVRVEREPITEANRGQAMAGPDISEEEHEVTLTEEEPVVEKRAVPKERVRLEKDVEQDERQVSEQVRKERIETDGADDDLTTT